MSRHGTARQSLDWDVPRVEQNGTGDEQRRIEGDERSEAMNSDALKGMSAARR